MNPILNAISRPIFKIGLLITVSILLLPACHTKITSEPVSPEETLHRNIAYLISDPNLFNAMIGIYVESLDNGDILFKQNEHKLFIPASNMKLFTSATALLKFGAEFRYKTELYTNGYIEAGILKGNLIVHGKGDPSISPRFYNDDFRHVFSNWAAVLKAKGITEINGDIIGDAAYFQDTPLGAGWEWDDEPYWYAAQISALSLNDNCVDITILPGDSIGAKPIVQIYPPTEYVSIENKAITIPPDSVNDLHVTRKHGENRIIIENSIPINVKSNEESITVEEPALFFITVMHSIFRNEGIRLKGKLRVEYDQGAINYNVCQLLHVHESPPLGEILKIINKVSHNLYIEQILLTLGAEFGDLGTAEEGAKVVSRTMNGMGIPENEFVMQDGSGLSRHNLITPRATAVLLRNMALSDDFDIFYRTLPVAGEDGTLKRRMKGTNAAGRVHAKTGTVGYVRNLSGYVTSDTGERFIFSLLVNHYTVPTSSINLLQDRLCDLLARFERDYR